MNFKNHAAGLGLVLGDTCLLNPFASSCMAKHVFVEKSVVLHFGEGPELMTHY